MAEFGIVDLTAVTPDKGATKPSKASVSGQSAGTWLGSVDTAVVAASLEALREDLASQIKSEKTGLGLTKLTVKLTLSAEGKVAFVAKGSAEACIEVVFATSERKTG